MGKLIVQNTHDPISARRERPATDTAASPGRSFRPRRHSRLAATLPAGPLVLCLALTLAGSSPGYSQASGQPRSQRVSPGLPESTDSDPAANRLEAPRSPATNLDRPDSDAAGPPVRLDEVLAMALRHNPSQAVFQGNLAVADARALQARVYPNPGVELQFGAARGREWPEATIAEFSLELSQPIEWPARRQSRILAADTAVQAAREEEALLGVALRFETSRAYYTVLYYQQALQLARDDHRNAAELEAMVARRVDGGEAPEIERIKARVETLKAGRAVYALQRQLESARTMLRSLCGEELPARFTPADNFTAHLDCADPAAAKREALDGHPRLSQLQILVQQREQEIRAEEASRRPGLTVGLTVARQFDANSLSGFLRFDLPFWDRNLAGIAAARGHLDQAAAELGRARLEIIREVELAAGSYEWLHEQLNAFESGLLQGAAETYRIEQLRFEEGEVDFLHLLDSRRTARQTELEYLQTLYDAHIARLELDRAIGKGVPRS